MKTQLRFIMAALSLLSFSGVFAQKADTTDFYLLSLSELMNIPVTTASKFEQSIKDAPSTTSLITRDQILKYGWLSGNEVLNRLPGFNISQDYDRQTVSSRGIYEGWNNNHMLMLIDGVPMNDNMYGTAFTWEITPLVFTKSLEIIRGPGSALYGTNATNGVISYNTLSAKDLSKKVEVRYRIGSRATQVYDLLASGENDAVSFVSAFNYYNTNGNTYSSYDASYDSTVNTVPGASRKINNGRSSYYFFNKIEGKGKLQGLSLQYHEQSWNFSTGHGWLFYVPDKSENMNESRRLISLRYKTPNSEKRLSQEYLVRFQRHSIDWNTRLAPDNTSYAGFYYQYGMTEILKTHTSDVFARAQLSYSLGKNSVLLGGIENSYFFYDGDDIHQSNVDLNSSYLTNPGNQFLPLGPYFAYLGSHPYNNTGVFAQYTSPKLFDRLSITAGSRYDYLSFKFNDAAGVKSRSFSRLTPRLSLVYTASEKLTFKLMGGQAFRTPSPSELFGLNTYLLGSSPNTLKPEVITTFEFASDFAISKNVNWRFNAFHTEFDDQIGYSPAAGNYSANLYSLTSSGIENEFMFKMGGLDGFLNHSFVVRQNESINDATISESKSQLTWVPQNVVNLGLKYSMQNFTVSGQAHYQGAVNRRLSDTASPIYNAIRGTQVDSWTSFDLRLTYKPTDMIEIGLIGTNLGDVTGKYVKYGKLPFDYQMTGRTILFDVRLMF
jgi:iron complex outermembrane receptor protein